MACAEVRMRDAGGRPHVVEIYNDKLFLSFNLLPFTPGGYQSDFAGAATSVRLFGDEMLDACARGFDDDWRKHDPEKKCLHIDQIDVLGDVPGVEYAPVSLLNRPYRLVHSDGLAGGAITIASDPFEIEPLAGSGQHPSQYEFVRNISLAPYADFVIEELSLRRVAQGTAARPPRFAARYVSCMDMSFDPSTYRYPGASDWFGLGSGFSPFHGYGFATSALCTDPAWGLAGKNGHNAHKWFSWKTLPAESTRCLHLFAYGKPGARPGSDGHVDHAIGHLWYENIFNQVKAA